MENEWTKRIEELEAEVGRLQMMNPCNHTGFESAPCDVCGYPDPRKLIAKLKAENKRLAALNDMFPQEIARLEDRVSAEYEAERADDRARIKELEAENKRLRELVDGARVIVEVFQWSTPAQERWREEWLKKAAKAMKEASHE